MNEKLINSIKEWGYILPRRLLEGIVGKQDELVFEIHNKEKGHNRPHIHVKTSCAKITISIDDKVEVINASSRITQQKIEKALEWTRNHINELREKWNDIPDVIYKFDLQ